jgi:hypothetical protein
MEIFSRGVHATALEAACGLWLAGLRIQGMERVTGIEPALSAWEFVPSGPVMWPDLQCGMSASDGERPFVTGVNGTLMAWRTVVWPADRHAPALSVLPDSCHPRLGRSSSEKTAPPAWKAATGPTQTRDHAGHRMASLS